MDEVGDYMSSPVLSIDAQSSVQEAAEHMNGNSIGALLVKDLGNFVGIITETDLTRRVVGKGLNPESTLVSEVMTKGVLSIDRFLPMDEANKYMHTHKIRHLAVTEEEQIVGMLSVKDLVSYYAKSFRMQE
ncbi:MAG: CBS domain-containing protein [Nitrospinae bacterium]|nr:CBS domain-containing protein [Nitrospinota bacterium]